VGPAADPDPTLRLEAIRLERSRRRFDQPRMADAPRGIRIELRAPVERRRRATQHLADPIWSDRRVGRRRNRCEPLATPPRKIRSERVVGDSHLWLDEDEPPAR